MRFQRDVNSYMGGNVISLLSFCGAVSPGTFQAEIVGWFSANMFLTEMVLYQSQYRPRWRKGESYVESFRRDESIGAVGPLTGEILSGRHFRGRHHGIATILSRGGIAKLTLKNQDRARKLSRSLIWSRKEWEEGICSLYGGYLCFSPEQR